MSSSDDEGETLPQVVSDYDFQDKNNEPISFSELPIQWSEGESPNGNKKQIFLRGTAHNGLLKIYKQVTAWKFDLSDAKPEISVLAKENKWMKLQKPRKSFEDIIRTILITVHCLHFLKKNPESGSSGKSLWDHLAKVFRLYEVRPSKNDLADHVPLISEAVKREKSLAKSEFLLSYIKEKHRKRKAFDEVVQTAAISGVIVNDTNDDIIDDTEENASDEEEDIYDSVCAFCDNGGELLGCEGQCLRSFHATVKAGAESNCASLGLTDDQVEAMQKFLCNNCQYQQHQCFSCGKLGSSDKSSGMAEVFPCVFATCGHFYHPRCVAKLLHRENEAVAEELEEKIAVGESFICPIHKCYVCREDENKKDLELQFAVCRRCPKSYHRKCLPRRIAFEDLEDEGIIQRAWEDLLPNRILIYCLEHEIDDEFGTPAREHIEFPNVEKKKNSESKLLLSREKGMSKKRSLTSEDSPQERTAMRAPKQDGKLSSALKEGDSIKKAKKRTFGSDPSIKSNIADASSKSLRDNVKSVLVEADNPYAADEEGSELVKQRKQGTHDSDLERIVTVEPTMNKFCSQHQSDADSEKRILALMKEVTVSVTLETINKKQRVPSTYAYSSENVVDKTITQEKVEGAVEAIRTAMQKLEAGCSIEDAKAVCEPDVLHCIVWWKDMLEAYLSPFLHGMCYTSFRDKDGHKTQVLGHGDTPMLIDGHPIQNDEPAEELKRRSIVTEGHNNNGDEEGHKDHGHENNPSRENSEKRRLGEGQHGRGTDEVSSEEEQNIGRPSASEVYRGMPHEAPHIATDDSIPAKMARCSMNTEQPYSTGTHRWSSSASPSSCPEPGPGPNSFGYRPSISKMDEKYRMNSDIRSQPKYLANSMGFFAPGPHLNFSHKSSSGWLDPDE